MTKHDIGTVHARIQSNGVVKVILEEGMVQLHENARKAIAKDSVNDGRIAHDIEGKIQIEYGKDQGLEIDEMDRQFLESHYSATVKSNVATIHQLYTSKGDSEHARAALGTVEIALPRWMKYAKPGNPEAQDYAGLKPGLDAKVEELEALGN